MDKDTKILKLSGWAISKESLACEWIEDMKKQKRRRLHKGEIYLCELGENIGHEQCNTRPVLIVSDNRYNMNGQVTIVPLTTTVKLNKTNKEYSSPIIKTSYVLRLSNYSFLTDDSTVLCSQISSISVVRLTKYIGKINDSDMVGVKVRVKSLLDI